MPARLMDPHLGAAIYGAPSLLGTIVATTTKNNNDTAAAFNNTGEALKGKLLLIQPDAACYIAVGTANTVTATTSGVKLAADQLFYLNMPSDCGWLACVSVSGTTNLRVFELR